MPAGGPREGCPQHSFALGPQHRSVLRTWKVCHRRRALGVTKGLGQSGLGRSWSRRPGGARATTMSTDLDRKSMRNDGAAMSAPVDARLLYRDSADPGVPDAQGLYDPRNDKDSCGVGFIADIKGQQVAPDRRGRAADPLQPRTPRRGRCRSARRRRRRHPGADPAQVLRPQGQGARHHAARARRVRHRRSLHAARRGAPRDRAQELRAGRDAGRPGDPRLAQRHADRQFDARRDGEADRALPHASFHWKGKKKAHRGPVRARALHPAQGDLGDDLPAGRAAALGLLPGVDLLPHRDLQGHVPRRPARHLLPGPARAGFRKRARARASALLDQHLPDLVAGASLPDDRPQRRDQHAARQQQLDGGAAGLGVVGALRRRHLQALADLLRRPVRHRLLRQRARIPGAGRLPARARDDDDGARGLGRQSADGRGAARLLRVQRGADGAVGRPRRARLHRRPADRRDARPQRAAARALSRHPRRPHHHGLRDGRAADRGKGHRRRSGGCSPARCCWSISSRAGSFPTRSSRRRSPRAIPTRSGWTRRRSCWRTCRPRPTLRRSRTCRCSIASRCSATPRRT